MLQSTQGKGDRTRRRILDAAASLVASAGSTEVTLSDIARAAELKPGSLYFHFASRDEVVADVLAVGIDEANAHLERALGDAGTGAAARLSAAIGAHLDARLELSDYAQVVMMLGTRVERPAEGRYEPERRRYVASWLRLIEDAQSEGVLPAALDPRLVCELCFAAMNVDLHDRWRTADATTSLVALLGLG